MLVHQCSSCGKLNNPVKWHSDTVPTLPTDWSRITVDMAWSNSRQKGYYDLCNECSLMPIKFGNIELNRNND
jgi:superfamily I DNA and RNA helicase